MLWRALAAQGRQVSLHSINGSLSYCGLICNVMKLVLVYLSLMQAISIPWRRWWISYPSFLLMLSPRGKLLLNAGNAPIYV